MIQYVGYKNDQEFIKKYVDFKFDEKINAENCCILPGLFFYTLADLVNLFLIVKIGFVDSHTHPIWEGDRVHEFQMKV